MKPLPQSVLDQLVENFRQNQQSLGKNDHWPVVRLFTPDAQFTWLFTEFDPEEELFFGLCDLGMGFPELGYVSLAELSELRGAIGLPVERDHHWKAKAPLSYYVDAAFNAEQIVEIDEGGAS